MYEGETGGMQYLLAAKIKIVLRGLYNFFYRMHINGLPVLFIADIYGSGCVMNKRCNGAV